MSLIPEPQGFVRNPLTENLDAAGFNIQNASLLSASVVETDQIGAIPPATQTNIKKTLNFRPGHELRFAGDGNINLSTLKINPQIGTTANVLALNTTNNHITYETPGAGNWYDNPAISLVDMGNFSINNLLLCNRTFDSANNTDTCFNIKYETQGNLLRIGDTSLAHLLVRNNAQPGVEFNIPLSGLFPDRIEIIGNIETGTTANDDDVLQYNGISHDWIDPVNTIFQSATVGENKGGGDTNQVLVGDSGTPNITFADAPSVRNTYLTYLQNKYTYTSPPILRYRTQDMFPMEVFDSTSVTGFTTVINGYWGTALTPDGRLFFIPHNNNQIGILNTQTEVFTLVGPTFSPGGNKWAGACIARNSLIYACPASSNDILVINPNVDPSNPGFTNLIPTGSATTFKWRGAVVDSTGRYVVFNPNNSNDVMVLDTNTNAVSFIPTGLTGNEKYGTVILAPNNLIYHTPGNRSAANEAVGITNLATTSFSTFGTFPAGQNAISRSGVLYKNTIFCPVRNGTSDFYTIDTLTNTFADVGTIAASNNRYFGCCLGADEKIYSFPHQNVSGDLILQVIDPVTNTASYVTLASGSASTTAYNDSTVNATGTKVYVISADASLNSSIYRLGVPKLFPWMVSNAFAKY